MWTIPTVPETTLPARMKSSTGLALHFMRTGLPRRSGACPVALRGVLNGEGASATTAPKCTKESAALGVGRPQLASVCRRHRERTAYMDRRRIVVLLLNVGLTRTRVPTATPEDDRGEKAEPRRYALLTLIRHNGCCRLRIV